MRIGHPADWELAIACGLDEPGRCCFADRAHQRLDVRWRPLKYVPNMDLMLDKYRRKTSKKLDVSDLDTAPEPWCGVVRKTPDGSIVHAGRFFRATRWLVEASLVWPGERDADLEAQVLDTIAAQDPQEDLRAWCAMGFDLTVPRRFDVRSSAAEVGKIRWELAAPGKRGPKLAVERLAMPEYWLKTPLREWVEEQLPPKSRVLHRDTVNVKTHRGEQLISSSKIGTLSSLRGLRQLHLNLAWQCPAEGRVYHVSYAEVSRGEQVALPEHLEVRCCRAAPLIGRAGTGD